MSGIPPEVELAAVIELASAQLGVPASEVRPLEGGQIARTFALSANGEEYVLQFHRDNLDATFEKTAAMADVFGSDRLPIPQVLRFGMFRDLRFALARRARGQPFSSLSPEAQTRALPSLMDTLDALHSQDLSLAPGFLRSEVADWPAFLLSVAEEERADGFYGRWHTFFADGRLDGTLFDEVLERMRSLLPFCPHKLSLIHGNFAYRNVLIEEDKVTAVLDWMDARAGDFLHDVATLDFWHEDRGFRALFRERYRNRGIKVPAYEQRILCYQCYSALDAFRFFAKSGNADALLWTTRRIRMRMGEIAPDWSAAAALDAARDESLEAWIHAYLRTGPWANKGLSDGLRLARRWWRGPVEIPLTRLERVCGPEEQMEFREPVEAFESAVSRIARDLENPLAVPPLIAEYRRGHLSVRDGSHRLAAAERRGWASCWVVIWYNWEEDWRQDGGGRVGHPGPSSPDRTSDLP